MPIKDRIEITENEAEGEVIIRVDTNGYGRAIADALVFHARAIVGEYHTRKATECQRESE